MKVIAYIIADDTGTIVGEGKYALAFRLFEYGDHMATYLSSDSKILKTKIGDTVNEYELSGSAPNRDLYVDLNTTKCSEKIIRDINSSKIRNRKMLLIFGITQNQRIRS